MRWLEGLFERLRPHFEKKGGIGALRPLYEAAENFFLASSRESPRAPHIRDPLDVKRYMATVIVALAPCVLAALYFFGWSIVPMIVVSYAAGGAMEVLFAVIRKEEINEGFLVTGLIFPLILPPTLPLWMVAVGVAFGVVVGKELFGGTGRNVFNPALVGRCFLALSYPKAMTQFWIKPAGLAGLGRLTEHAYAFIGLPGQDLSGLDAITTATPLGETKAALSPGLSAPELPSLWDMFIGNTTGCAGETSALAILLGGTFLLFTRVANWRTTLAIVGSYAFFVFLLQRVAPGSFGQTGVMWQLMAGGLLFGAFFMATDPVSSPISNGGKWAYGILIGGLTLVIRGLTGFVEGAMFAILMGNIAAPLLDEVVKRHRIRRLERER